MYLLTGATGFVGRSVARALLECGVRVTVAARKVPLGVGGSPIGLEWYAVGDVNSQTDWLPALKGVQTVVHCAARAHVMREMVIDALAVYREVNVAGTLRLAQQAAEAGVKRLVFISSIGVNGLQTESYHAFSEADQANPHNDYALSKYEAEQGLMHISAETGLEVVIIRPPLVYGWNAPGNFGSLMRAVQRGLPLPLGAVHNQRSLVALDNLVDFILTCIFHPQAANQTFLVSDGHDLSTSELVLGMAHAAGVRARLLSVPLWALHGVASFLGKGEAVQRLCGNLQVDIAKARALLNWVPPVSVTEGLRRAMTTNYK